MKIQHKTKTNKATKLIISVEAFCVCWSISMVAIRDPISPPSPTPQKTSTCDNCCQNLDVNKTSPTLKFSFSPLYRWTIWGFFCDFKKSDKIFFKSVFPRMLFHMTAVHKDAYCEWDWKWMWLGPVGDGKVGFCISFDEKILVRCWWIKKIYFAKKNIPYCP